MAFMAGSGLEKRGKAYALPASPASAAGQKCVASGFEIALDIGATKACVLIALQHRQ